MAFLGSRTVQILSQIASKEYDLLIVFHFARFERSSCEVEEQKIAIVLEIEFVLT